MTKVLAIIPARSGSKGVKNKNIKSLNEQPLISYTILQAKKSKLISKTIVSTDSNEIAEISRSYGAEVPFIRPKKISQDTSLTYDVVKHCIEFFNKENETYDIIVLLQPTTPLRPFKIIDKAIEILLQDKRYNSVVSVVDVDGYHPNRMKVIKNGKLLNYINQGFEDMRPRKKLPKVYIRSGAVYAIRVKNFIAEESLVSKDCAPLIMKYEDTINIDNVSDFNYCESILNRKDK
tara:strand:- start:388 stop:1089 length:702 start_codon:yes stop_codon:yes gene_type:complete